MFFNLFPHKHEQAQLEAIINAMVEGVVVVDNNSIITLANSAWYKTFGSDPKSLGRPFSESIIIKELTENIRNVISDRKPIEIDFGFDGRTFTANIAPFKLGCVAVINEVTRLKKLEEVRRDFTANVSHQMKTPLTSIIGYSETLLDGAVEDPKAAIPFVQTIHEQALKLKALIEDVLGLARIESNSWKPEFKELNIKETVHSSAEEYRKNKKGVTIFIDVPDVTIKSDKESIEHILHNLIDNGVKYTPSGGKIQIAGVDSIDNFTIFVSDTGIGIQPADIERVFERFYRSGPTAQTLKGGTGLGLAIVKHLIDKLNGKITVQSKEGVGTKFTIVFPKHV